MKIAFRERLHLNKKNEEDLMIINKIVEEYFNQGYKMTLRQLYYQLVARGIIGNKDSEYNRIKRLLKNGRMAGVVDWDAIEDRMRVPFLPYWAYGVSDAINDTIERYRLNRQEGQDFYIEVWVEKDALSNVLSRVTSYYHIHLMVNRGYSSCSAMYDAFKRLKRYEEAGKRTVILYLGDHDPSGLDMIRDVKKRLGEFGVEPEIKHIGITKKQIEKYNPPPNPAKITDPRARWYIQEHGRTSWEVDALNPKVLHELVKKHIEKLIDIDLFQEQLKKEEPDKRTLRKLKGMIE